MTEMIRTQRLVLRRARPSDLNHMHAVLSHPVAMRYWSSAPHPDVEMTRAWLMSMLAEDPAGNADFIVEHDGVPIGKVGCYRLPEVGYILHPERWGQGLAFEAMTAVIEDVFDRFPVDRLTADVDPRNSSSLRLLSRLNFVETGRASSTWRINDVWCDSVYLALDRPAAG